MKDEIKQGFERAIASRTQRDERAREEANVEAERLRQLETEWQAKCDAVIKPALNEIEATLKPAGWMTRIYANDKAELFFDCYRGNMQAVVGSSRRPFVSFVLDRRARKVTTYTATTSMGGGGASFDLDTLTADDVQSVTLAFFSKLSGD
ncbi:hypothetical protein BST63_10585 [Bradyrhizobium canariense]|uniref:DUF5655 domain-containing protein n=1 Tax=Bradyrhizobium canariense TaxID=255045 RepID=A0ABX3X677_9BRAD|nr:hypothetical protein [Bradyrhizobium canariense]OSJ16835.1 hypothetical protein BSR47_11675 [Bradyrhizobium canariense]OSJ31084.1 hypothetical protein BST63_10585 [Bradyrhizobium canariense]